MRREEKKVNGLSKIQCGVALGFAPLALELKTKNVSLDFTFFKSSIL